MSLNTLIKQYIGENALVGLEPGSIGFFQKQQEVIKNKPLLKNSYLDFYNRFCADLKTAPAHGKVLELGSGGGFLRDVLTEVITSDVYQGVADLKVDAQSLPFGDRELRGLFLASVLHHIPNVRRFFADADRTLEPGGICAIVEPCNTPFARFFYKNLHHEPFVPDAHEWEFQQSSAMLDSNQALSWMVFERDLKQFEAEFPRLRLEKKVYISTWSYFLSGGVNYRPLLPKVLHGSVPVIETLLSPLDRVFSLAWYILLRKT